MHTGGCGCDSRPVHGRMLAGSTPSANELVAPSLFVAMFRERRWPQPTVRRARHSLATLSSRRPGRPPRVTGGAGSPSPPLRLGSLRSPHERLRSSHAVRPSPPRPVARSGSRDSLDGECTWDPHSPRISRRQVSLLSKLDWTSARLRTGRLQVRLLPGALGECRGEYIARWILETGHSFSPQPSSPICPRGETEITRASEARIPVRLQGRALSSL